MGWVGFGEGYGRYIWRVVKRDCRSLVRVLLKCLIVWFIVVKIVEVRCFGKCGIKGFKVIVRVKSFLILRGS